MTLVAGPSQDINVELTVNTSDLAECMEAIGVSPKEIKTEKKMVKAFVSKDGGETINPEEAKTDNAGKKIRAREDDGSLKKLPAKDDDGNEIMVTKKGSILHCEEFNENQKDAVQWLIQKCVNHALKKENFAVETNPQPVFLLKRDEE